MTVPHAGASPEARPPRDETPPLDREHIAEDRLAGAVCRMVDTGLISSRSIAGDALLDYAFDRYRGVSDPIAAVRRRYEELESWISQR